MMARAAQREWAIQAVIRTGRTPRRNVKWSEFCDLVRAAARVLETQEEFPRGWSNAAIMNAAKKISRGPAVLCERCKAEISLANALDAEQDVDRRRREVVAGGKRRLLSRTGWTLFEVLYAAGGSPVSTGFLVEAMTASGLREHIRKLRRALVGSRYRIETYRGIGYGLTVAPR
jgi:DNA-binding response OmpR family regulator